MDHSEAATRARVREIPDGVYEAESFMDDDGVQDRRARADQRARGGHGRPDEGRSHRRVQAGRGLLQFRRDRGPLVLPGGVQMPDLGARSADQRRPVPRARHRAAAGPRGQRAQARRDAHVDDLSHDHHRHASSRRWRRRSPSSIIAGHHADLVRRPRQRPPAQGRQLLHLSRRADRRRLGRQAQQRRPQCHHRDERRRHPQRPLRAGRGEISAAGRTLCAAAGFRRRRAASAAGSAASRWCRRATTSASTRRWTG